MIHALEGADVEFMIVGAHALAAHGIPRATGDLDIFVKPSVENAARVMAALRSFGAPIESHAVQQADFAQRGIVYQLGLPPRRIDLLTEISGVSFEEAWQTRFMGRFSSCEVAFIGRDTLIKNKRAAGRDKDVLDVKLLEKRRG